MHLPLYAAMRARQDSSTDPGAWLVDSDRAGMVPLTKRASRALFSNGQAASGRVAIVSSLFLVLFAATLLIGGHAAIDPLLQSAADSREASSAAAVVYTMPDGIYCRRVSFDNVTAQQTEGGIERCTSDVSAGFLRSNRAMSWHNN
jgi:hypothetical protein